jgi:hypothetical protein
MEVQQESWQEAELRRRLAARMAEAWGDYRRAVAALQDEQVPA